MLKVGENADLPNAAAGDPTPSLGKLKLRRPTQIQKRRARTPGARGIFTQLIAAMRLCSELRNSF